MVWEWSREQSRPVVARCMGAFGLCNLDSGSLSPICRLTLVLSSLVSFRRNQGRLNHGLLGAVSLLSVQLEKRGKP